MRKGLKNILECDKCGSEQIKIYDSRVSIGTRWRARECVDCGNRFTTYEVSSEDYKFLLDCKNNNRDSIVKAVKILNKLLEESV